MATMSNLVVKELFSAAARTSTANGTGVDLQGTLNPGNRNMKAYVNCGATSGTPTLDLKLQESDASGSGYADITGAAFAQITAAGSAELHFKTNKRYVRAVATIGGGTPSLTFSCILLAEKALT